MPVKSRNDLLQEQIGQRKLSEWDLRWEPLPHAFTQSHANLRHVVGLFRTVLNGETKYIVRATEQPGGIAKGLRRIGGPEQTGNRSYGAQMIRQHFTQVKVDILRVEDENNPSEVAKKLKIMMVKYYDPEWAWPFRRRMEGIRAGKIKAYCRTDPAVVGFQRGTAYFHPWIFSLRRRQVGLPRPHYHRNPPRQSSEWPGRLR